MIDCAAVIERRTGLQLDEITRRRLGGIDPTRPGGFEEAVEEVVVPETWFFRDSEPFVYLARFAAAAPRPLRVLSAPCSTGEEPYSIAIALLEACLEPGQFEIDAVDISRKALEKAERAVYSKRSFRRARAGFIERWFDPTEDGFALRPAVSRLVRFRWANLMEPTDLVGPYHVIFCRNLLIYLHAEGRARLMAAVTGLLAEGGVLFAGHAEVVQFTGAGLRLVRHPRAFACSKPTLPQPFAPARAEVQRAKPAVAPAPARAGNFFKRRTSVPAVVGPTLDAARRLADAGRFAEASAMCRRLGPSADVFFLSGLISQACDRFDEAEEFFRRALYLDPLHLDALLQMSVLCETRGDRARSALFRDRARRAKGHAADLPARKGL